MRDARSNMGPGMIGLLLAAAFAAGIVVAFWYAARWAFATDRAKSHRDDVATFKSEVDRFLRDPMHFGRS